MKRKLLVIKAMLKGKPIEAVVQSDAEYITVRNGNTVRNLSQVLDSITKEINALNSFKRSFGFTKQDHIAMDSLMNMIDYMEDKDNANEIMNQIKNINDKIELLEEAQESLSGNITNLADALTILQKDLNDANKIPDNPDDSESDNGSLDKSENTENPGTDSNTGNEDSTGEMEDENSLINSSVEITLEDIEDNE